MSSPYRLDHEKVIVPETDSLLAVIPLSARNVILSLCEYLNWPAFWRANPPDQPEWDNIQSIIAELEQAMTTAISVQSLDDRLTEIADAIAAGGSGGAVDCSCFEALIPIIAGGSFPPIEQPDFTNPDVYIDDPNFDAGAGAVGDLAACGLALELVTAMASTLRQLAPLLNLGAAGFAIAGLIFVFAYGFVAATLAALTITGMTAATIWAGLLPIGASSLSNQADALDAAAQDIACEFAGVWIDSKAAIRTFLSSLTTKITAVSPSGGLIARSMYGERLVGQIAQTNINDWPQCGECEDLSITNMYEWDFRALGPLNTWRFIPSLTSGCGGGGSFDGERWTIRGYGTSGSMQNDKIVSPLLNLQPGSYRIYVYSYRMSANSGYRVQVKDSANVQIVLVNHGAHEQGAWGLVTSFSVPDQSPFQYAINIHSYSSNSVLPNCKNTGISRVRIYYAPAGGSFPPGIPGVDP